MLIVNCHNVVSGALNSYDRFAAPRIEIGQFTSAIDALAERFAFITMDEMLARLDWRGASQPTVTLTFDDGYQGVLREAFPVLQARGIMASVMVVTQVLEAPQRLFHFEEIEMAFRISTARAIAVPGLPPASLDTIEERLACLKAFKQALKTTPEATRSARHDLLLRHLGVSREQLQEQSTGLSVFTKMGGEELKFLLSSGWAIGSHTCTHRTLSQLDDIDAAREIAQSHDDIRAYFGVSSMPFAYPYGGPQHVGGRIRDLVARSGYSCALSTRRGAVGADPDRFALRRVDLADCRPGAQVAQ